MVKIYLITKNPGKLKAAKAVFEKYGIKIEGADKDFPEIQGETSLEVARFTALQAAKDLNAPTIRDFKNGFAS